MRSNKQTERQLLLMESSLAYPRGKEENSKKLKGRQKRKEKMTLGYLGVVNPVTPEEGVPLRGMYIRCASGSQISSYDSDETKNYTFPERQNFLRWHWSHRERSIKIEGLQTDMIRSYGLQILWNGPTSSFSNCIVGPETTIETLKAFGRSFFTTVTILLQIFGTYDKLTGQAQQRRVFPD
ncbi:hypothetical protein AVEN_237731-1 [Araneus ventricosus]|uniref:Uncharacterized protein n=1 Tax=Araneus ventricosus TaxID=182803 RepID=A0A4Y2UMQ9_ARAVE|nr:hypothetical protein AVEN_237731-1 [Araneus ventricosus]